MLTTMTMTLVTLVLRLAYTFMAHVLVCTHCPPTLPGAHTVTCDDFNSSLITQTTPTPAKQPKPCQTNKIQTNPCIHSTKPNMVQQPRPGGGHHCLAKYSARPKQAGPSGSIWAKSKWNLRKLNVILNPPEHLVRVEVKVKLEKTDCYNWLQ